MGKTQLELCFDSNKPVSYTHLSCKALYAAEVSFSLRMEISFSMSGTVIPASFFEFYGVDAVSGSFLS